MNDKVVNSSLNKGLWGVALVLLLAGFAANYYFIAQPVSLRVAGWIVLVCIFSAIVLQTTQGKSFWSFAVQARAELRRVVWPTRRETVQITAVVFLVVVVLALILWAVDSGLLWLISWFTGHGG